MQELSIYTYTIVYSATAEFADRTPYCAAILELTDGNRFPAMVNDYREGMDILVGQPVYIRDVEDGVSQYYFLEESDE